jgi:WD40 repeat protein
VFFAAFSPNGMYIVTAAIDGSVWLWNATSFRVEARWHGHQDVVTEVAFDATGDRAVTASADGSAIVWRVAPQLRTIQLVSPTSVRIDAAAFSPDGTIVATGAFDGTLTLWDAATGAVKATLQGHKDRVSTAAFSPTGAALATGSSDGTVRIWDPARGTGRVLAAEGPVISELAWSPDASLLAASSEGDGTLRCWEVATGKLRFSKKVMPLTLRSVTFDPTGRTLVTSGDENNIYMVHLDGNVTRSYPDPETSMHIHTELDPAGQRLLIVSAKQSAKIVQPATSNPPVRLVGHVGSIMSGTWSPDGTLVITAALDGTARLWDARTGDELAVFQHPGALSTATFSPDGARVLLAGHDGTAEIHDLPQYHASSDELAHLLRCRVPYEVRGDRVEPRKRDEQGCAGL